MQITVSRSFGTWVSDPQDTSEALATLAMHATEKLRARGLTSSAIGIFAETDSFKPGVPQHNPSRTAPLASATSDSRIVLTTVRRLIQGFMREGFAYKRPACAWMDLAKPEDLQGDLFTTARIGDEKLMSALDATNRRFRRVRPGSVQAGGRTLQHGLRGKSSCLDASPPHWQVFPAPRADRAPASLTQAARTDSIPTAACRHGHPREMGGRCACARAYRQVRWPEPRSRPPNRQILG